MEKELRKKKILFVITLGELGGAQKYVRDLSLALKDNYDITIAPGSEDDTLTNWAEENKIKTVFLPPLGRRLWKGFLPTKKDYQAFGKLLRIFREGNYDIVHLNSSKIGFLGAIAAKIAGASKIIFTAHGWVFNEPEKIQKNQKKWLWILLSKLAARFQDRIICVSNYDLDQALKYRIAPPRKLYTVYNGLERQKVRFASRQRAKKWLRDKLKVISYKLKDDDVVVGTVANHYPTKDLSTIIMALKHLPENVVLTIIGDGPERKNLQSEIINLKLQNRVFLLGKIPNGWQWIKAFDIYAISSLKEGLPYSTLEAMAASAPIVSTPAGGLKELLFPVSNSKYQVSSIKQRALKFEPGNSKELTEQIKKLLENKELADEIAQNAEEAVRNDFTFEQMVSKTKWIYEF